MISLLIKVMTERWIRSHNLIKMHEVRLFKTYAHVSEI